MLSPKSSNSSTLNKHSFDEKQFTKSNITNGTSATSTSSAITSDVSTISSDIRIGRNISSSNSSSLLSEARGNKRNKRGSSSIGRGSFSEGSLNNGNISNKNISPKSDHASRQMGNDEIIDLMEREQDGIVLKLMKEIKSLKEENSYLKKAMNQSNALARRRSSGDSSREKLYSFSSPFIFDEDTDRKKFKRKPSQEIPRSFKN